MGQIDNGNGTTVDINAKRELKVFSVSESEAQAAAEDGNAYNINTGEITLTTSTSSALLYFKNDEIEDYILETLAVGFKNVTCTDSHLALYVERNPTGGTIIDDASNVDMSANRNFGSSESLKETSFSYKASAQSKTFTGGEDIILIYIGEGRGSFPINMEIPRGSSIGIRVDSASLAATAYVALIGHLKDDLRD